MPLPPEVRDGLVRTGTFTVRVVPSSDWLAIRTNQHQALPWHETVLRPILRAAHWVGRLIQWLQHGDFRIYCLYVVAALVVLLLATV